MVNLWIALTLGVIFIIIPIVVMGMAGVNMVGKMMKGLFSMALRVGIIGSIVYWLVQWDSIALDIVFVIIMLFYSAIEVKVKCASALYVVSASCYSRTLRRHHAYGRGYVARQHHVTGSSQCALHAARIRYIAHRHG